MDDFYRTQGDPVNPKKKEAKGPRAKTKTVPKPVATWTHGKHLEACKIKSEFH